MTDARLEVTRDGAVGHIKFVNPDKLNALSHAMWQGLGDALNEFSRDSSVGAVLISGAGRKAFTTGADISQFAKFSQEEFDRVVAHAQKALDDVTKPTIAVIHGYCVGGGLDIALRCDMRFANTEARFAAPDPKIGTAWGPGTKMLVDVVGGPMAREMILTCRMVDAAEAYHIRLANRLVPADDLDRVALEEARKIAEFAPLSILAAKVTLRELLNRFDNPDLGIIYGALKRCTDSDDFKEGQRAFGERRKPNWKGR